MYPRDSSSTSRGPWVVVLNQPWENKERYSFWKKSMIHMYHKIFFKKLSHRLEHMTYDRVKFLAGMQYPSQMLHWNLSLFGKCQVWYQGHTTGGQSRFQYLVFFGATSVNLVNCKFHANIERWDNHCRFGTIGLHILNTRKSKMRPNLVFQRVCVPCWHVTSLRNATWKWLMLYMSLCYYAFFLVCCDCGSS